MKELMVSTLLVRNVSRNHTSHHVKFLCCFLIFDYVINNVTFLVSYNKVETTKVINSDISEGSADVLSIRQVVLEVC